jgi:hypothetical protein
LYFHNKLALADRVAESYMQCDYSAVCQ